MCASSGQMPFVVMRRRSSGGGNSGRGLGARSPGPVGPRPGAGCNSSLGCPTPSKEGKAWVT